MLIYLITSMVSVQELFHLQPNITLVAFCLWLLKCLRSNFLLWGRRLGRVMTVMCHTPVSSFTGHAGNSYKKWFCLVSMPWGEGDCLWVSLSVLRCLKCHCPTAACWDPGSKKHARVVELSSLRSTSVLGERQPLPYQLHMLLTEFRKTLQECDVWYLISTPKCSRDYGPPPFWVSQAEGTS